MDHFSPLLTQFGFTATVFFRGEFCGANAFHASDGCGQLHLVRGGHVVMQHQDGPPIDVRSPALVLYPRPHNHRLVVPPGARAELLCANLVFRCPERNPLAAGLPDVIQIPLEAMAGLGPTLLMMFEESAGQNVLGQQFILDRLCDVLVMHVIRHALASGHIRTGMLAGLSDAKLALALQAVHADPAHSWTIDAMAKIAGLSRTGFITRFRDIVGTTPADYVQNWRLDLAQTYLKERRSVKEVARAIGYANQPAFTRAFVARHGMAPTEWLRQSATCAAAT